MIEIALSPCLSVSKPFAAGAKEQVSFVGADVADGMQIALYDSAGTVLALADVASGGATLDLDTQEAFAALDGVPVGGTVPVWCIVGDADTHIATLPARLILNALDTNAHPPAPVPDIVKQVAEALKAAQAAAEAAKTSEDEAAKSAQGAQAAQEAAEGAAQAAAQSAQAAQTAATTASSAATVSTQRAAEANARAGEAANSAVAADDAAGRAYGAQTAAEAAKTAAETAKTAAETAKAAAETAKTAATQKATEAAASAQEAAETAAGLEDALVQVSGLEGRVAKLEDGKGVYVDEDGNVEIYTPLPDCPDGTLKVTKDLPNLKKVCPVEIASAQESGGKFRESTMGDYIAYFYGEEYYSTVRGLIVYDKQLNRVFKISEKNNSLWGNGQNWDGVHSPFFVRNGRLYLCDKNANSNLVIYDFANGDNSQAVKRVKPPKACTRIVRNPLSGHVVAINKTTSGTTHTLTAYAYDDDLNPILGDDGAQITSTETWEARAAWWATIGATLCAGRVYFFTALVPGPLLTLDENDQFQRVHEHILSPVSDEDDTLLLEHDDDGNPIRDDPTFSNLYRPQTTEGREIWCSTAVAEHVADLVERGATNPYRTAPIFVRQFDNNYASGADLFFDGFDAYFVLSDGRFFKALCYNKGQVFGNVSDAPTLPTYYAGGIHSLSDRASTSREGDHFYCVGMNKSAWSDMNIGLLHYLSNSTHQADPNFKAVSKRIFTAKFQNESYPRLFMLSLQYPQFRACPYVADRATRPGYGFFGSPSWFASEKMFTENVL